MHCMFNWHRSRTLTLYFHCMIMNVGMLSLFCTVSSMASFYRCVVFILLITLGFFFLYNIVCGLLWKIQNNSLGHCIANETPWSDFGGEEWIKKKKKKLNCGYGPLCLSSHFFFVLWVHFIEAKWFKSCRLLGEMSYGIVKHVQIYSNLDIFLG